jgi:polysaccharide export outer membrane protein
MNIFRFVFAIYVCSFCSCTPYKDLLLFRSTEEPLNEILPKIALQKYDATIQPNDALTISVSCFEPQLAIPFNLVDTRNIGNIDPSSALISYLVNNAGEIEFPVLGRIYVGNKTIGQIRDLLTDKIKPFIKDPIVIVRRVNFRITVLGEVQKPGSFSISSERVTILEALGMAGDMTAYSDRQRVLVVREENGVLNFGKVDLQSSDFFSSPYYYLHQNDVVYVDPKKSKKAVVEDPATKYITWATVGFSVVSSVVTMLLILGR